MRSADIVVGRHYAAVVGYGPTIKVEALEVGVARPHSKRKDGVRVRCLEESSGYPRLSAGEERTIAAIKVAHEWSAEDDAVRSDVAEAGRRATELRARLDALGVGYGYGWRGEAVSPEVTTVSLPLVEAEKLVGLIPGSTSA
jgi:hypothetical protein